MMAHVDLCSGIGGFALGFEWAGLSKPVLFCDIEPWSRKVLAKHWPDVPIAEDVKELANDPARLVPDCDILTAGYPCQPWSVAGVRRGEEDDRHIWPEIFAIVQAKRPTWCVFENVYGHISLGLDQVLSDLEDKAGYAVQTFCIPACGVDAPHRRDRVWIVGHTEHDGSSATEITGKHGQDEERRSKGKSKAKQSERTGQSKNNENVADTDSKRGRLRNAEWQNAEDAGQPPRCEKHGGWDFEPPVGRVANGIPSQLDRFDGWEQEPADIPRVATGIKDRVSRLKGLGNAIVPAVAQRIGETIKAVHYG